MEESTIARRHHAGPAQGVAVERAEGDDQSLLGDILFGGIAGRRDLTRASHSAGVSCDRGTKVFRRFPRMRIPSRMSPWAM